MDPVSPLAGEELGGTDFRPSPGGHRKANHAGALVFLKGCLLSCGS